MTDESLRHAPGLVRSALHGLAQAEWPHVGPYSFDLGEAVRLVPNSAFSTPACGQIGFVCGPDRVLLFMIDDNAESAFFIHVYLLGSEGERAWVDAPAGAWAVFAEVRGLVWDGAPEVRPGGNSALRRV